MIRMIESEADHRSEKLYIDQFLGGGAQMAQSDLDRRKIGGQGRGRTDAFVPHAAAMSSPQKVRPRPRGGPPGRTDQHQGHRHNFSDQKFSSSTFTFFALPKWDAEAAEDVQNYMKNLLGRRRFLKVWRCQF